jgi:hypothetical protein
LECEERGKKTGAMSGARVMDKGRWSETRGELGSGDIVETREGDEVMARSSTEFERGKVGRPGQRTELRTEQDDMEQK